MVEMISDFFVTNQSAILRFIIVLVVGQVIIKLFLRLVNGTSLYDRLDPTMSIFFIGLIKFILYSAYIIILLGLLGVPITTFIAMLSAVGLAIALALQGNLSNFASALVILFFKPFEVGDFIQSGAHMGTVNQIQLLFTHLLTPDNRRIIVPNSELVNGRVVNFSSESTRRIELTYKASYDHDVDVVIGILQEIIFSNDLIQREPEPIIRLINHGDNALEYDVKCWVNAPNYWEVRYWLNEEVRRSFVARGIHMPLPQREITVIDGGHMVDQKGRADI